MRALKTNNRKSLTILEQMGSSKYKGVYPSQNKWRSQIKVSQSGGNIIDSCILKIPAISSSQIDGKMYHLGLYDDEADAARAFDRVASVLGRPLNFPEEDESEIIGLSSEGADQAVAEAVQAAETFMGTGKAKKAKRAAERAKKVGEVQPKAEGIARTQDSQARKLSRFLNRWDRPRTRESIQTKATGGRKSL